MPEGCWASTYLARKPFQNVQSIWAGFWGLCCCHLDPSSALGAAPTLMARPSTPTLTMTGSTERQVCIWSFLQVGEAAPGFPPGGRSLGHSCYFRCRREEKDAGKRNKKGAVSTSSGKPSTTVVVVQLPVVYSANIARSLGASGAKPTRRVHAPRAAS